MQPRTVRLKKVTREQEDILKAKRLDLRTKSSSSIREKIKLALEIVTIRFSNDYKIIHRERERATERVRLLQVNCRV